MSYAVCPVCGGSPKYTHRRAANYVWFLNAPRPLLKHKTKNSFIEFISEIVRLLFKGVHKYHSDELIHVHAHRKNDARI